MLSSIYYEIVTDIKGNYEARLEYIYIYIFLFYIFMFEAIYGIF